MSGKAALYRIIGPSKRGRLDTDNIMSSAEELDLRTKGKGRRNGVLAAAQAITDGLRRLEAAGFVSREPMSTTVK